jgi:acetyl-CoA carboxylase biotin carboxylase subunit
MIAKLIVKGDNREDVVRKSLRALKEFHIGGVHTTIPFHQYMLHDERFLGGDYPITYIDSLVDQGCKFEYKGEENHT